jgi:hypothetical protein
MNTETLLGALVESRKALVESQRAIDAILLQHTNAGNAELAGEQSAMGRISMSNGDRSMVMGRQNMLPNDAHFEFLDNDENKNKVGNDLKQPTNPVESSDKTGPPNVGASQFMQASQNTKEKAGNGLTQSTKPEISARTDNPMMLDTGHLTALASERANGLAHARVSTFEDVKMDGKALQGGQNHPTAECGTLLEKESSQAVPTNGPALQVEGTSPVELTSGLLKGGSVGNVFERQQEFASVSEASLQHMPPVSVLGKTGTDPHVKLQTVDMPPNTGNAEKHSMPSNAASQDDIFFRRGDEEGKVGSDLEIDDTLPIFDSDSSTIDGNGMEHGEVNSYLEEHPTTPTKRGLQHWFDSPKGQNFAAMIGNKARIGEQGLLVNPNFDTAEEELPLKDTQHLHVRTDLWASNALDKFDHQVAMANMVKSPHERQFIVAEVISDGIPFINHAIGSLEKAHNLELQEMREDKQATVKNLMHQHANLQRELKQTINHAIKNEAEARTECDEKLCDMEKHFKHLFQQLKRFHEEELQNRVRDVAEKQLTRSEKRKINYENEEISILEAKLATCQDYREHENILRQEVDLENSTLCKELLDLKHGVLSDLNDQNSTLTKEILMLKRELNDTTKSNASGLEKVDDDDFKPKGFSRPAQEPLTFRGSKTALNLSFDKRRKCLENFYLDLGRIKRKIEGFEEKQRNLDLDPEDLDVKVMSQFRELDTIIKSMHGQETKLQERFLNTLDERVAGSGTRRVTPHFPLKELNALNDASPKPAKIMANVMQHIKQHLSTFAPIFPWIMKLAESLNGKSGLFEKPLPANANFHETLSKNELGPYIGANKTLWDDLMNALDNGKNDKFKDLSSTCQGTVKYGIAGSLETQAEKDDGMQFLYSLLCSQAQDVQVLKSEITMKLSTVACAQFMKHHPGQVCDKLQTVVTQALDFEGGAPKIAYSASIGLWANALIGRNPLFMNAIMKWITCPKGNSEWQDDAIPAMRSFFADVKAMVTVIQKPPSFQQPTWARTASTVPIKKDEEREILECMETAFAVHAEEDDDANAGAHYGEKDRGGKRTQQKHDSKTKRCMAKGCSGKNGPNKSGNVIHSSVLKASPRPDEIKCCLECFIKMVNSKQDLDLSDGTKLKYKEPSRSKSARKAQSKNVSNSPAVIGLWYKHAMKPTTPPTSSKKIFQALKKCKQGNYPAVSVKGILKAQKRTVRKTRFDDEADNQTDSESESSGSENGTDNDSEQGEDISAEIQKRVAVETKRYIDSLKKKGKLETEMRASSASATNAADGKRNSNKVQELLNEKKINEDSLRDLEVELAKAGYSSE